MLVKDENLLLGARNARIAIRRIELAKRKLRLLDALIQSLMDERNPDLAQEIESLIDSVAMEITEQIKGADFSGVLLERLKKAKTRERRAEVMLKEFEELITGVAEDEECPTLEDEECPTLEDE